MKKILFILLLIIFYASSVKAADFYIGQSSAGGNTGADCADQYAITFFNTAGNWHNPKVGGEIGPGDTVHFCGTITTTATVQASGSAGSVITLHFETGAVFTSAAWLYTTGAINTNQQSYILIDGGTNGTIQNTANGSALGNQVLSTGILASGSSNLEIKNLTIGPIYVHSSLTDTISQDGAGAIYWQGYQSNVSVHNNTIHDVHWAVNFSNNYGSSASIQIYDNNIYNVDHGIALGNYGSGYTLTNVLIHDNQIHDYSNWDTTADVYHHDGIHVFYSGGASISVVSIYNNLLSGNTSTNGNFTSHIYMENATNSLVYNNVMTAPPAGQGAGFGYIADGINTGNQIYNNTLIGGCSGVPSCYGILVNGNNTIIKNNIIDGFYSGVLFYESTPNATWDYNLYTGNASAGQTVSPYGNYTTLANWQTYLQTLNASNEVNAVGTASPLINSDGSLQAGSPAIGAAKNLTSLNIAALDTAYNGNTRPSVGAWDIGANEYQSAGGATGGVLPYNSLSPYRGSINCIGNCYAY